jgi:hypothetical protein
MAGNAYPLQVAVRVVAIAQLSDSSDVVELLAALGADAGET